MFDYKLDNDGVVTLTWDMADRATNVLNGDALAALDEAVKKAVADESVKGIIITSGKSTFVTGGDLKDIEKLASGPLDADEFATKTAKVLAQFREMETCGKPVVAAINGTALGGGYELCLACHYRVCADSPKLQVGLPEAQLGLMPGAGGTQRLPRLIGIQNALQLILEGKSLNAEKAAKMGLVNEVVPGDKLIEAAKKWILDGGSPVQPWDNKRFRVPGGGIEEAAGMQVLMGSNAMIRGKTYGNFPHTTAILSSIYEGLRLPIHRATNVETRYFLELLQGPVARNMIRTMFFGIQDANKLVRRPKDVPTYEIKKIGILGAGLMGAGIAFVAAKVGVQVVLLDRDQAGADKGKAYSEKKLDRAIAKKRSTPDKKERVLARIKATTDYADLADCDVVVEAVFEDRGVKAAVTKSAEAQIAKSAIFGSNTSTLPITGLAEASERPDNFIGMHFFSPVERMPLVEVIRGKKTSDECLAKTLDFIKRIGKTPIVVNDSRGFYTSRVFGTYITEGSAMLSEGATPALIENAGKMSGMPMPPLGLADEVGLDLMYKVGQQTKEDLGDEFKENASGPILELLVAKLGRHGRKNGKGYYEYDASGGKKLWKGISEHYKPAESQPNAEELIKRFLYTQALETVRCIEEGVIESYQDCDVGAILGWGFAAYTGGPLSYIDMVGVRTFVQEADRLEKAYGERFKVPNMLRDMAEKNKGFYG